VAGLLSIGVEVMRLGIISTPGVAYLTRIMSADAGVMISASHNLAKDEVAPCAQSSATWIPSNS